MRPQLASRKVGYLWATVEVDLEEDRAALCEAHDGVVSDEFDIKELDSTNEWTVPCNGRYTNVSYVLTTAEVDTLEFGCGFGDSDDRRVGQMGNVGQVEGDHVVHVG